MKRLFSAFVFLLGMCFSMIAFAGVADVGHQACVHPSGAIDRGGHVQITDSFSAAGLSLFDKIKGVPGSGDTLSVSLGLDGLSLPGGYLNDSGGVGQKGDFLSVIGGGSNMEPRILTAAKNEPGWIQF